jgi:hypothetical protein
VEQTWKALFNVSKDKIQTLLTVGSELYHMGNLDKLDEEGLTICECLRRKHQHTSEHLCRGFYRGRGK